MASHATLHIQFPADPQLRSAVTTLFKTLEREFSETNLRQHAQELGATLASGVETLLQQYPLDYFRVEDYVKQNGELRVTFKVPHTPNAFLPAWAELLRQCGVDARGGGMDIDPD
ncbi:MAG: hypothetical protein U1F63_02580 [Chitinivorax sp.]